MSRHNALCHDSEVRRCVANKARCGRDRGALQRTIESGVHDWDVRMTSMSALLGYVHDISILSRQRFLCCDRLVQKPKKKKKTPGIWGVTIISFFLYIYSVEITLSYDSFQRRLEYSYFLRLSNPLTT